MKTEVMRYFRWKRQVEYVVDEVGYYNSDILAIDGDFLIEVECKVSLSDLRADLKKREKHQIYKDLQKKVYKDGEYKFQSGTSKFFIPNRFYFCVPSDLAEKALEIINEKYNHNYGLLSYSGGTSVTGSLISSVKKAGWLHKDAVNPRMKDIILKRCVNKLFTFLDQCRNCKFSAQQLIAAQLEA